jgi:hypothetical protein
LRRVASFLALPAHDGLLLLKALSTVVTVRVGLKLFSIDRLRAWARRFGTGTTSIDRLAWSVRLAARLLPGTTCLGSAFALQRLLSAEGHASELHVGVARQAENFAAHAWLTCDGRILVGEEQHGDFTRLVVWTSAECSPQAAARTLNAG